MSVVFINTVAEEGLTPKMTDRKSFITADHITEQEFIWKSLDDLQFSIPDDDFFTPDPSEPLPDYLKNLEKKNIQRALQNNSNVIAKAARDLGISRERLHHRIKSLDIDLNTL